MSAWILLSIVVGCTVMGDLLSSFEMKRHGEVQEFHPRGWGRLLATLATKKFLILSVFFMAISFFAFIKLVETADLSFAVPASVWPAGRGVRVPTATGPGRSRSCSPR